MPTSAFRCRVRAKRRRRRCSSTVKRPSPCAGIRSRPTSSESSTAMSSGNTDVPIASTPAEAAKAVQQETRFGVAFLKRHGWRLLLVFAGLLLPLWILGALIETLREGDAFAFDIPLLEAMHHV